MCVIILTNKEMFYLKKKKHENTYLSKTYKTSSSISENVLLHLGMTSCINVLLHINLKHISINVMQCVFIYSPFTPRIYQITINLVEDERIKSFVHINN